MIPKWYKSAMHLVRRRESFVDFEWSSRVEEVRRDVYRRKRASTKARSCVPHDCHDLSSSDIDGLFSLDLDTRNQVSSNLK